jgi:hypothetical protein
MKSGYRRKSSGKLGKIASLCLNCLSAAVRGEAVQADVVPRTKGYIQFSRGRFKAK